MNTRSNLMQLDGVPSLSHYYKMVRSFLHRSQVIEPTKKIIPVLPKRKSSVIATVLADLLSGGVINSIDSADDLSTTRLKDNISTLRKRYGWEAIESSPVAKATADGRVQWVSQYWLPINIIDAHSNEQTRNWIKEVRVARGNKRANYKFAKERARASLARKIEARRQAAKPAP
jgi:hypothetical protein